MSWGPALSQALKANSAAVLRSAERLASASRWRRPKWYCEHSLQPRQEERA